MAGYYVPERPSRTERALNIAVNLGAAVYVWWRFRRPTLWKAGR